MRNLLNTCDMCGAQFAQSGDLKMHIRTHTGENLINVICVVLSMHIVVTSRNTLALTLERNLINAICVVPSLSLVIS